jgi:hypothetical protein
MATVRAVTENKLMSGANDQNSASAGRNGQGFFLLNRSGNGFSVLLAIGIALMPKCAVCWSVYLSFLSSLGIVTLPYSTWIRPGMLALLMVNLLAQGFFAKTHKRYGPLILSALGVASILLGNLWSSSGTFSWIGVALIFTASCLNLSNKKGACATKRPADIGLTDY